MKRSSRIAIEILLGVCIIAAVGLGIGLGIALASARNLEISEDIGERRLALPSQILDRNDRLITEYFSDEKRDIAIIDSLPPHLIYALITAEDRNFFSHRGIDILGTIRAQWNNLRGTYFSGASSISQQVAGELFTDRRVITYKRKLTELWYAFQMERQLTKYQILELYMNTVYFGHNTHGVEAAAKFYFGKSAQEINLAESAILVVQIRSPAPNSMINHPNVARGKQKILLDQMVELGYVTKVDADLSYELFWDSYDVTRSNRSSAYFANESRAPYFTEYVRLQLEEILYGPLIDVNREGLIIHTTLDLDMQDTAQEQMSSGIHKINDKYQAERQVRIETADRDYMPVIHAASLLLGMDQINLAGKFLDRESNTLFFETINPILDVLSIMFDDRDIRDFVYRAYDYWENQVKKTTVEGALITLENGTGNILAMVGGSEFKTKKYNRAVDATVQPGSSFKPLYYSAAISTRTFTPASMIMDEPVVFFNADGEKYEPTNYLGEWRGPVRLRVALANSMNVPSVKVLDAIGFDTAIERASRLLGMYELRNNESLFPRKYPLALGVVSVAPINMARAYSVFTNQGRVVEPIAIRYIEDRKGNIIREYEKEMVSLRSRKSEQELQILTPQEAYIMTSLLQSVVQEGTLRWRRVNVGGFDGMPMGGKTGTNTNWADAWTVGFSPYYTTAVWFGFDLPGESLGRNQTGATAAGPIWAQYMKDIHAGLEVKQFVRPDSGIITRTVCAISGLLPTDQCDEGTIDEIFLAGSEPNAVCDVHPFRVDRDEKLYSKLKERLLSIDVDAPLLRLPTFDYEILTIDDAATDSNPSSNGRSTSSNPLLD